MNATKKKSNTTALVIAAVVVAVVAALVVALVAGGSSDDESSPNSAAPSSSATGSAAENQPVEVVGSVLVPLENEASDPAVGQPAPTLRGATFDGSPLEITPGGGNDQLIVFLAHWCPHCNAELPIIEEWRAAGMIPDGLDLVAVSTAVSSDRPNYPPSKWLEEKGWTWPALADSADMTAAEAYGVTGYPFMVIVGPDGNVKGRTSGQKELAALDAWVTSTLGR
jgi:cytochrome c biogenesis protein CcmG/thiol:disulfide interchange protein DsbE